MLNSSLSRFFRSPSQQDRSFLSSSRSVLRCCLSWILLSLLFPRKPCLIAFVEPCFHVFMFPRSWFSGKTSTKVFSNGSNILRILPTTSGGTRWAFLIIPAVVELVLCIVEPVWICSALNYVDMIVRVAFFSFDVLYACIQRWTRCSFAGYCDIAVDSGCNNFCSHSSLVITRCISSPCGRLLRIKNVDFALLRSTPPCSS